MTAAPRLTSTFGLLALLVSAGCEQQRSAEIVGSQGSFVRVSVDGHDIEVPCDDMNRDIGQRLAQLSSSEREAVEARGYYSIRAISDSTKLEWTVNFPTSNAALASAVGTAPSRYPLYEFTDEASNGTGESVFGLRVKLPSGDATYMSQGAELSSESYHEVTVESAGATETTVTYRVRASYHGAAKKVVGGVEGGVVPLDGAWSLLLTYAK